MLAVVLFAIGCSHGRPIPGTLRFHNRDVAWRVAEQPIAKPEKNRVLSSYYHLDQLIYRPADRYLAVPRRRRAANTNALGEVPSSSWFENRIGRRMLSPAEVERGPVTSGPDLSQPLVILAEKAGGTQLGFLVRDARGDRYFIKFDRKGVPVAETAADVIVNRLLWAAGYHVAEDSIIFLRSRDLVLAEDATTEEFAEREKPFTRQELERRLGRVDVGPDGRIRALASKFLPGIPVGGFSQTGVRGDDANDVIAHERRRELRGSYVFFSWLKSTDLKTDNTLDMWQSEDGRVGTLRHYFLDFGMSLGVNALAVGTRGDGYERFFDWRQAAIGAVTFGLLHWHWESFGTAAVPHVGVLEADGYYPDKFHTRVPYLPWLSRDRFDEYWAAKILARFEEEHIRAAVRAARYPLERTRSYVTNQLLRRREIALRHWFGKVLPIDELAVRDNELLCFADLGRRHGVLGSVDYRVEGFDERGRSMFRSQVEARGHEYCAPVRSGADSDGYTIVVIHGRRAGAELPPVAAHLARDPATGRLRVIGARRE